MVGCRDCSSHLIHNSIPRILRLTYFIHCGVPPFQTLPTPPESDDVFIPFHSFLPPLHQVSCLVRHIIIIIILLVVVVVPMNDREIAKVSQLNKYKRVTAIINLLYYWALVHIFVLNIFNKRFNTVLLFEREY